MDYNICRLCLIPKRTDHPKFKNIFTTFGNFNNRDIKIIDAIVECAPIQIKENDNFPKDICVNCLEKLQNSYEFREICIQSDLKLKSLSVIKKQEPADNGSDLSDSHHNYDDLYDQENEKIIKEEFPFSLCSVSYNVNTESGVGEHFLSNETKINDIKKENSFESDKNDEQNEENLLKDRKTFKCKHCTKSFHQKLNLLKHQRKHTKEGNYVCDLCSENFTTKYFLTKHKKEIHDENDSPKKSESFQCNFCKKSLFSRQSLENHLRSHTGERPFKCEFCSKGFKQKSHLLVHIKGHDEYKRSKKGPRKIFNCKHCDKTFAKAYLVNIHSRIHTGERPFTCEFCNKGFRQKIHLSRHRSIHTGEKNYACNLCSERFTTDYFLTIHKRNSHPDSQDGTGKSTTNFQCSLCEKALFSRQSLENHLRSHTGERPFKCEFCSKAFKQKSHLLVHIKGHTNDKRHLCQICSAAFLRNSSLKRHMSKHNKTPSKKLELNRLLGANRNAFTCNSCGEGFISKQEHSEHMRLHAGEYAFICDTCGNGFKTSGAFKNHQLTHTGERAYHCTICTKKFAKKDQLRAHLAVHNDDLPHKCRYCPKRFKWGTVLRRHEMRHTGDRPYKCSVCNKGFIEAGALRRHLRVHTGERPYKCELCFQSFKAPSHLKTHMNVHKN